MPKKGSVLKYIPGEKSAMTPFGIYADLESILEKIIGSLFSHCLFDKTKNKVDYYRGKNCIKNFSLDLREHAEKTINYEQAKIIAPTKKEKKAH